MFEIESKSPDEITFITKKTTIKFNIADAVIDAGLAVGKITGPGEFEIGEAPKAEKTEKVEKAEPVKAAFDFDSDDVASEISKNLENLVGTTDDTAPVEKEILIGETNRDESKTTTELKDGEYLLFIKNKKITVNLLEGLEDL